jgi:predicted nuclease with TOPRIM domain
MFAHNLTEPRLRQSYLWALKKMERAAEREFDCLKHLADALELDGSYLSDRLDRSKREVKKLKARIKELETKLEGEQLSRMDMTQQPATGWGEPPWGQPLIYDEIPF